MRRWVPGHKKTNQAVRSLGARRPSTTNKRTNEAVVRDLTRDERRTGLRLLKGCASLSALQLGLDAASRGRPRKHRLSALLGVLLLRYFFANRKGALVSREDIVQTVTRKHTRANGSVERIPNSFGIELGLTEGQGLRAADLDRAMLDMAGMGIDILNVALEHLTRWMRRLHPSLGRHLVYDSMPIASFPASGTPASGTAAGQTICGIASSRISVLTSRESIAISGPARRTFATA